MWLRLLIDVVPERPETRDAIADGDSLSPVAPFRIMNIGGGQPVKLMDFIAAVEEVLGKPAKRNMLPMQPGDVVDTWADSSLLERLTGFRPQTGLREGTQAVSRLLSLLKAAGRGILSRDGLASPQMMRGRPRRCDNRRRSRHRKTSGSRSAPGRKDPCDRRLQWPFRMLRATHY